MSLELEIAVIRGQDWVYRGTFRPPAMVSLGASLSAVLAIPGADLPDYHELVRIYSDGGVLFFEPGMAVELRLQEGTKRNDELLEEGLAAPGAAGWKVPLGLGSRGAFRISDVSVLFKVRARGDQEIRSVQVGAPTVCGGCSSPLAHTIVGFGALSPCTSCGVLNEVQPTGPQPGVDQVTQRAPTVKRQADLPTFDAISVRGGPPIAPTDRVARERLSDLPTFDSISVGGTPSVSSGPRKAIGDELSMPTQKLPQLGPARGTQIGATKPVVGADLPTFDAISVLKHDSALATQAVMNLMRGASDDEPPISNIDAADAIIGEAAGLPEPEARTEIPFLTETSTFSTGSEVEVTIEDENDFFDSDAPVSMDLQRSYNAIPILTRDPGAIAQLGLSETPPEEDLPEPVPTEAFAGGETRRVLVQKAVASGVTELPDTVDEGGPIGFEGDVPIDGRTTTAPRFAAPAPRPVVSPPAIARDGADGSDVDDFLMGRVSIPEVAGVQETNRWLIVIGTISGILGLALILYGFFG